MGVLDQFLAITYILLGYQCFLSACCRVQRLLRCGCACLFACSSQYTAVVYLDGLVENHVEILLHGNRTPHKELILLLRALHLMYVQNVHKITCKSVFTSLYIWNSANKSNFVWELCLNNSLLIFITELNCTLGLLALCHTLFCLIACSACLIAFLRRVSQIQLVT